MHNSFNYLWNISIQYLPLIKFKAEISSASVNFLDVAVSISEDGDITTCLYTKPTGAQITWAILHATYLTKCANSFPYSHFHIERNEFK